MEKKSEDFSVENVKKLANSPAGRQLISTLQRTDSNAMNQAAAAANAGDYKKAGQILEKLLTPELRQMIQKLGG